MSETTGTNVRKAIGLWAAIQKEEKEWAGLIRAMSESKQKMDESNRRYRKAKHDFKTNVSVNDVINDLSGLMFEIYGYTPDQVRTQDRERGLVDCRRALSIILVKVFRFTLKSVGAAVGRDHSTIIHHLETHDGIMDSDAEYRKNFDRFIAGIEALSKPPEPLETS